MTHTQEQSTIKCLSFHPRIAYNATVDMGAVEASLCPRLIWICAVLITPVRTRYVTYTQRSIRQHFRVNHTFSPPLTLFPWCACANMVNLEGSPLKSFDFLPAL